MQMLKNWIVFDYVKPVIVLIFLSAVSALGQMSKSQRFLCDFSATDANSSNMWSFPGTVKLTDKGIGWSGMGGEVRDIWMQSKAIPVGVSWRPPHAAHVKLKVEGPAGTLFVRYSPDMKHWSTWQVLHPINKAEGSGWVQVTRRDRKRYVGLLQEYMERDVPWCDDEEAAVIWILENQPEFFREIVPFVGYVQFLYETSGLESNEWIRRLDITISWTISGTFQPPESKEVKLKDRMNAPWRFKAED